jgi:hypothetical protein
MAKRECPELIFVKPRFVGSRDDLDRLAVGLLHDEIPSGTYQPKIDCCRKVGFSEWSVGG